MIPCKAYKFLAELEVSWAARHVEACDRCTAEADARRGLASALRGSAGPTSDLEDKFVHATRRRALAGIPEGGRPNLKNLLGRLAAVTAAGVAIAIGVRLFVSPSSSREVAKVNTAAASKVSLAELRQSIADARESIPWQDARAYIELSSAIAERRLPKLGGDRAAEAPVPAGRTLLARVTDPMGVRDAREWQNLGRRFGVDVSVATDD